EPEGSAIGTVDEDFAVESLAGDVFLLGTTSWRIRRIEAGRVCVEDGPGAPPSLPLLNGGTARPTAQPSPHRSPLRGDHPARRRPEAVAFLMSECALEQRGAEQAVDYVLAGKASLGAMPTHATVVAERFFDEAGGMQLVLHAPFGARINRAWGLALRKRFCRS